MNVAVITLKCYDLRLVEMNSSKSTTIVNSSRNTDFLAVCASALIAYYVVSQWFPYAESIYNANTDWSQVADATSEPWDGTLLGMYLFTVFGWFLLGLISTVIGSKIQRKTGRKLHAMLYLSLIHI